MRPCAAVGPLAGPVISALMVVGVVASAHADVIQIKIAQLTFTPPQVSAHVGDAIEWVNADFVAHTATARDGAWDVMIPPNTSQRIVLKTGGTVDYYCKFHPTMTGRISVAR